MVRDYKYVDCKCGENKHKAEYTFVDGKLTPVWKCINCGHGRPRKVKV